MDQTLEMSPSLVDVEKIKLCSNHRNGVSNDHYDTSCLKLKACQFFLDEVCSDVTSTITFHKIKVTKDKGKDSKKQGKKIKIMLIYLAQCKCFNYLVLQIITRSSQNKTHFISTLRLKKIHLNLTANQCAIFFYVSCYQSE